MTKIYESKPEVALKYEEQLIYDKKTGTFYTFEDDSYIIHNVNKFIENNIGFHHEKYINRGRGVVQLDYLILKDGLTSCIGNLWDETVKITKDIDLSNIDLDTIGMIKIEETAFKDNNIWKIGYKIFCFSLEECLNRQYDEKQYEIRSKESAIESYKAYIKQDNTLDQNVEVIEYVIDNHKNWQICIGYWRICCTNGKITKSWEYSK